MVPPVTTPATPAPAADPGTPAPDTGWRAFLRALTPRRIGVTLALSLAVAVLLNPIYAVHFSVLFGRTLFVGFVALLAFTAAAQWRRSWLPTWFVQAVSVAFAAPVATLAVYLLSTGGDFVAFVQHEGRVTGFIFISASAVFVGVVLSLGAVVRERDADAKAMALQLALQREQLERHAADARLAVLTAQVEPHFLFNTLANVQALVETGSPRAAPVLRSLIAYLRATMPRLDDGDVSVGREIALVRSYLELMHLRMPDRLDFRVEVGPGLERWPFPPMGLLTLVENAVRHGIDPSETGGRIEVEVRQEGARVRMTVSDDGAGMSESAQPGTGLRNLRERLAAFYGGRARLELSEREPHGLLAEIVVDATEEGTR
jgi:signal transduction histidine kinase